MSSVSLNSSDEETDGILKPVLEVKISSDFNPNSIPQDGYEYLQHVIYERNRCKGTAVTNNINPRNYDKYQTFRIELESIKSAPSSILPSKKWQECKCEEFDHFRRFLDSKIVANAQIEYFNEDTFIDTITTTLPRFSKFIKYSQSSKIRMIEMITTYLGSLKVDQNIDDRLGIWIFAVLATLENPLTPNCCFALRELAKKLIDIRAVLSQDIEANCTSLNFYICIISKYFKQFDLAD